MDKNILSIFVKDPEEAQKIFIYKYGKKPLMEFAKQMRDTYRLGMAIPPVFKKDFIMWRIVAKLILKEVLTNTEKQLIPTALRKDIDRDVLKGMWKVDPHVRRAYTRKRNGKIHVVAATIVRADRLPKITMYGSKKLLAEYNKHVKKLAKDNIWSYVRPIDWLKEKYGEDINLDDFRNHLGAGRINKPIIP